MKESHPWVIAIYYMSIITVTLFTMNPLILGCSLVGSICFFILTHEIEQIIRTLFNYVFLFLILALVNPLFSHNGETILFFLNDQPVTLEALQYGVAVSTMLVAMMFWCKALYEGMTTDKFIYLFGKGLPKSALLLSMSLRFIPLMKQQSRKVSNSQKTMGLYAAESYTDKLFGRLRVFDSVITWALENGIETADSMKARGYGLKGRTSFSIFTFRKEDGFFLTVILLLSVFIADGFRQNLFEYSYYPVTSHISISFKSCAGYISVLLLALMPALVEIKEKIKWK